MEAFQRLQRALDAFLMHAPRQRQPLAEAAQDLSLNSTAARGT